MLTFYNLQHRPILPSLTSTNFDKVAGTSIAAVHHRIPGRRFSSFSIQTSKNASEPYISSVGTPPSNPAVVQWNLTQRHLTILNFMAYAVAISATWLFLSAIPALLAFKRAAESMAKLMDVTREEIPDTMAAVRLSGMEISDLIMELSDIGRGITQGVKSSTQTVRMAEEKLRGLTKRSHPVFMQGAEPINNKTSVPVVAKTARGIRESIVKGRSILQMLITVSRFSGVVLNYLRS